MDRDGTGDGYDLELTRAVAEAVSVPVIASGGAGTLEHLRRRRDRGPGRRRAGGVDLPLRPAHGRRGQALPARSAACRCGSSHEPSAPTSRGTRTGCMPAVVQETETGEVLMVAWMNREALEATLATGGRAFLVALAPGPSGARARRPGTSSTSTASTPTATATRCWSRCTRRAWPATPGRGLLLHASGRRREARAPPGAPGPATPRSARARDPVAQGRAPRGLLRRDASSSAGSRRSAGRSARRPRR